MIQNHTGNREMGFTLIELMIVIAIIGILAAIAVPNFMQYRQNAFNSKTMSDIKNAMTAQESYYFDNSSYAASVTDLEAIGWKSSADVVFDISAASATGYTMAAFHTAGNQTWTIHGPGGQISKDS